MADQNTTDEQRLADFGVGPFVEIGRPKHAQRTIERAKARHRRMSRNVDAIAAERASVERIKP